MTCPTCNRDRVKVMMALTEAKACHNRVLVAHLLECSVCRAFFPQEVKQEVGA